MCLYVCVCGVWSAGNNRLKRGEGFVVGTDGENLHRLCCYLVMDMLLLKTIYASYLSTALVYAYGLKPAI